MTACRAELIDPRRLQWQSHLRLIRLSPIELHQPRKRMCGHDAHEVFAFSDARLAVVALLA